MDSQRKRLVDGLAVESWKRAGVYDGKVAVDSTFGKSGERLCRPRSHHNGFISFEQHSSSKKMI